MRKGKIYLIQQTYYPLNESVITSDKFIGMFIKQEGDDFKFRMIKDYDESKCSYTVDGIYWFETAHFTILKEMKNEELVMELL